MIGNNDHCAFQYHFFAKIDISRNSQMIQLQDVRNGRKPFQELFDFFEIFVTKL